jgi:chromosome partitioning protein
MPIIPFVSPKGGTGKSTSALLLATFLAKVYDVTVIDADPNRPIHDWASGGNAPPRLTVVSDVEEDTIMERIEDAASKTPFVIVDLEGTASKIVLYAISQADFVLVPMQGSHEDAKAASRAVRVIRQSEKMTRAPKPFSVLLTRTNPMIRTRSFAHIQKGLIEAGVPVLRTELMERDAFKALFSFQQTLDGLDPQAVPNLDKAKLNVGEFAQEVIERIMAEQGGRKGNDQDTDDFMGAA